MIKLTLFFAALSVLFAFPLYAKNQPTLHICTIASHETKELNQLLDSCARNNLEVNILGLGKPYVGHGLKITYVKEFIHNLPDVDVVLVVDAYDVLVLASKEEILEKYLKCGYPVLFGAETNLFRKRHLNKYLKNYPKSPTKFRYLNAGTWIGRIGTLKQIFAEIKCDMTECDQAKWTGYFVTHQELIGLDYQCELFLNLHKVYKREINLDVPNGRVTLITNESKPCCIHGNGLGTTLYQHIYEQLFLN